VQRSDNSRLTITADGTDHLEAGYQSRQRLRRLRGQSVEKEGVNISAA
jgi:hypothetical protein